MKLAAFDGQGNNGASTLRIGIVEAGQVFDVTAALPSALDTLPAQRMNWLIANWSQTLPALQAARRDAKPLPLSSVTLLPANPSPPHVFAAPANYRKHQGELAERTVTKKGRSAREQGFFLKAPASLVGSGGTIVLPRGSTRRFDHESELAVIVGKAGRNIARADAMAHVFGYACLIDATMRIEPGVAEEERSMRKSFAGFTPLGPWIVTADEVSNPELLSNQLWVNGELRQDANTRDMIVGIAELIEMISCVLPISAGDVIAMGTPEGVGPFVPGDTLKIAIEQVGEMSVHVAEAGQTSPRAY